MPIFDPTKCPVPSLSALPTDPLISDCSIPAAPPPILDCPNLPIPVPPFPGPPGKDGVDGVDGQPGSPGPCPQLQGDVTVTGDMSPLPKITLDVQNADGEADCGYCQWVWVGGGWAQVTECPDPNCICPEPDWPISPPPPGTPQVSQCQTDNCNKKFQFTFDFPGTDLWGECCAWCWDGTKWTKKWGPEPGDCPTPSIGGDYCGQIEISCPCDDCGATRCEDCLCEEGDRYLHLSGCDCLDSQCIRMTSTDNKTWTGSLSACSTTVSATVTRLRKKTGNGLPDKITVTLAVSGVSSGDACYGDSVSVELSRTDPVAGCSYYEGTAVLDCGSCSDTFHVRVECGTSDSSKWQVKIVNGGSAPDWGSPDWTSTEVAADDGCLTLTNTALTNSGTNNYSLTFCSGGSGQLTVNVAPAAGYGCDCWKMELSCGGATLVAYEDTSYAGCDDPRQPYVIFKETTTPSGFCCSGSIIGTFNCTDCAIDCCGTSCSGGAPPATIAAKIVVGEGEGSCAQACATGALSQVTDDYFCLAYDGTVTITCGFGGCTTTIPLKLRCIDGLSDLWELRVFAPGSSAPEWDTYVWSSGAISPDDGCITFYTNTIHNEYGPARIELCDGFTYPLYIAIGKVGSISCPTECCGEDCATGLPASIKVRFQTSGAPAGDPCENICGDVAAEKKFDPTTGCVYYEGAIALQCSNTCGNIFQLRLECSDPVNDKWVLKIIKGTGAPDWSNPDWTSEAVKASDGCLALSNDALTNSGSNKYSTKICNTSASATVDLVVDVDAECTPAGGGGGGGSSSTCGPGCGCPSGFPDKLYVHWTNPDDSTTGCAELVPYCIAKPDMCTGPDDFPCEWIASITICGCPVDVHFWCYWALDGNYYMGYDNMSGSTALSDGSARVTSCTPFTATGSFISDCCPFDAMAATPLEAPFTINGTPC